MRGVVRKLGHSSGIIIPKVMLAEIGMKPGDDVELGIEAGRLVIAARKPHPRTGRADDARQIAERGDVWLVALDPTLGREIKERRPAKRYRRSNSPLRGDLRARCLKSASRSGFS